VRRQLALAIGGLVALTLAVTIAASLLLVHRAATSTAEDELVAEVQALRRVLPAIPVAKPASPAAARLVELLGRVGADRALVVVGLTPSGRVVPGLPAPLVPGAVDLPALERGDVVAGNVGDVAFCIAPVALSGLQRQAIPRQALADDDLPLLVATRRVRSPVNGLGYFVVVALVALGAAGLLGSLLARRFAAPVLAVVAATRRIAAGELDVRVGRKRRDPPELLELARSVDAMAEALERAKGLERQFLLSVSHELRTPLTAIKGYAEALAEGALEDTRAATTAILQAAGRLERLVADLLDLARLDARRFALRSRALDAAEVAREVAASFAPEAAALGVELATSVKGPAPVVADPDRIRQMAANVVENALKFAAARVVVGTSVTAEQVILFVEDDGPGIPPEEQSRVFERHYRSDRYRGRRVGTGLGLAIVAELAQAMGAHVAVVSPVASGRGTRMELRLRREPSSHRAPAT
jgi:two-component system OmpR family sensor kinase